MTEAEFLTSTDPTALLSFVCDGTDGWRQQHRATRRTLRLFVCACVRQAVPRPGRHDEEAIRIVEDTKAGEADGAPVELWKMVSETTYQIGWSGAETAARHTIRHVLRDHATTATPAGLAALLREIVGNPFRPATLPVDEECKRCKGKGDLPAGAGGAWVGRPARVGCEKCGGRGGRCSWLTPLVAQMARTIYDDRAFGDLPILADALEDAGCDSEAILMHLRSDGPHVRGCWALDSLLGLC